MTSRTSAIGRILHALRLIDCPIGNTPVSLPPAISSWQLEGVVMLAEVPELAPLATELIARLSELLITSPPGANANSADANAACAHGLEVLKARAAELFGEYLEASLRLLQDLEIESDSDLLGAYRLVQRDRVRKGLAQLSRITQLARDSRQLLGSAVLLQRCFTRQSYVYFVAEVQALKEEARGIGDEVARSRKEGADAAAA